MNHKKKKKNKRDQKAITNTKVQLFFWATNLNSKNVKF